MSRRSFPQVRTLKTVAALRDRLAELGVDLPVDDELDPDAVTTLASPLTVRTPTERLVGNRFAVLPMEGWDADRDGSPTDLVERRWRRFGMGGAKLIWGGEAVAVRADGRANPRQLRLGEDTVDGIAGLRLALMADHERATGRLDDLVVGLQLTHSGRYSRPDGEARPRPARRDAVLDSRVGVTSDDAVFADDELDELVDAFVSAAVLAEHAGFDFVDVKACHGYLGHELLSRDIAGRYGGPTIADRARFHLSVLERIRSASPGLGIGVRLSAFDIVPFSDPPGSTGVEPGVPAFDATGHPVPGRFGMSSSGLEPDLDETRTFLDLLVAAGATMVCVTGGSPYYNPHVQRPAYFPPSDGYLPPEDPLVGVGRLLDAAAAVKAHRPELTVVGSGYSYLQEWLPVVAQAQLRLGRVDSIGLGRMALSYPDLPLDVTGGLERGSRGPSLDRRKLCRTFSDCTTAPRHGLVSGCYPLDEFYKRREERVQLAAIKRGMRQDTRGSDDDE